jgi:hypothetical protein
MYIGYIFSCNVIFYDAWVVTQDRRIGSWTSKRGDQIGRIFAYLVIVYFGHFLEITLVDQILGCNFPW